MVLERSESGDDLPVESERRDLIGDPLFGLGDYLENRWRSRCSVDRFGSSRSARYRSISSLDMDPSFVTRQLEVKWPVHVLRGMLQRYGVSVGHRHFLFTDIEGSTRRWEQSPAAMGVALARHDAILERAISSHGGVVFFRMGDGMAAAFASARGCLEAADEAQRGLAQESWPDEIGGLRVRMGRTPDKVSWSMASTSTSRSTGAAA